MKTDCSSRSRGFSLVEVTLAVALTATVALALLGLVPVSIESMRASAVTSAHARILQTVAADCQMLDWSLLTSAEYQSKTHAFDFQGGELASPGVPDAVYLARAEVQPARALPGGTGSNTRMRLVRVGIVNGNAPAAFGTSKERRYAIQIAQTDDSP